MKKQQLFLLIILCFGVKSFSQLQKLVSSQKDELVIMNTSDSYLSSRKNVNGIFYEDFAGKAKIMTMEKDAPALPTYSKSLELSNKGKISIVISYDSFEEFENINVLPSKGSLKRNVNPDLIPYVFGEKYSKNSFYPGNLAVLGDPFIFRNTRGVTISFNPYQYNPVTKKLRVYKNITVKVIINKKEVGVNEIEASNNENNSTFPELYKNLYINALVANPVRDKGEMLIIAPVAYTATLQPFIDWKIEKGIKTTLATLTQTGSTAASIKTYVQNFFAANPNLVYVQLVGDHENLPSYSYGTSSENETLWSDSFYGQLAGTDLFPEVMVGRFSGSTTDVKTMIDRILEYETNPLTGDWMTKAIGIASNEGAGQGDEGEADYVHMRNIRTKFMSFGYTAVHEFYQGSQGGADASGDPTAAIISPAINQGVGILNYTGHGDLSSMVTGNYTINNVNGLTNSGKYPFVISVACNNGTFVGGTSLCEAFTRVKYNNTPAGAIASCGSSILMAWAEPMQTQDEMTELIIRSDSQNIRTTLGGLFYNGQVSMLETYNQNASSKEVMETWVFFGDPSTEFRSKVTTNITATHPATISTAGGNLLIQSNTNGATVSITQNNIIIAKSVIVSGSATVLIPALASTNSLKVTLSKDNAKPYRGTITVTTLGLPEYDSRFVIYPNPTSDFINIENTKNNITNAKIQLIDLNGRVIFSEDNVNLISKYSIPVSSLATGLYILDINDGGNRKTQKIQIR